MPTEYGKYRFQLRPERYTHDGGHYKYNIYVRDVLDSLEGIHCDRCFVIEFNYFVFFLKHTLKWGDDIIIWRTLDQRQ